MLTSLTCWVEVGIARDKDRWVLPSLEDAMPLGMNDRHFRLGEDDHAVKVGKRAQASKSMGGGGHHMALHGYRGKIWGRGKGHAGNQSHQESICHLETRGRSLWVQVSNVRIGRKINTADTRVGNTSAGGGRKVGEITRQRS